MLVDYGSRRHVMIRKIRDEYNFRNEGVLEVMLKVRRHKFVPKNNRNLSYNDSPIDIGNGQTMSQPYTVALMTQIATEMTNTKFQITNKLRKTSGESRVLEIGIPLDNLHYLTGCAGNKPPSLTGGVADKRMATRVLEIGTGSGYQAAILSYFFDEVFTMEIVPRLAKRAERVLKKLEYNNVFVIEKDGYNGWNKSAPYDAIMITAAINEVPGELFGQLKPGGVLVAPVGKSYSKTMTRYLKIKHKFPRSKTSFLPGKKMMNDKSKIMKIGESKFIVETFGKFHFVPFVEK